MKDLSQLLFLSCWGLASATWLRSCDIQSGEVMIIPQLNELSFDMPIFMYIQEGTRFRNGSQWYLCRLPFAIFMCDRVAHLWHPDLELEDKEEKGEEVPVEQAIVSWTHQWPAFEGWSDDPIHGAQDGVAGLYLINILNIYSAIIVVIIFSLICANLYSQNTFQERQREKQTCVFSNHSEPQSTQNAQRGATRQLEERIKKLQSEVEDPKVALAFAGWALLIFWGDGNDGAWDVSDTNPSTRMYRHYSLCLYSSICFSDGETHRPWNNWNDRAYGWVIVDRLIDGWLYFCILVKEFWCSCRWLTWKCPQKSRFEGKLPHKSSYITLIIFRGMLPSLQVVFMKLWVMRNMYVLCISIAILKILVRSRCSRPICFRLFWVVFRIAVLVWIETLLHQLI